MTGRGGGGGIAISTRRVIGEPAIVAAAAQFVPRPLCRERRWCGHGSSFRCAGPASSARPAAPARNATSAAGLGNETAAADDRTTVARRDWRLRKPVQSALSKRHSHELRRAPHPKRAAPMPLARKMLKDSRASPPDWDKAIKKEEPMAVVSRRDVLKGCCRRAARRRVRLLVPAGPAAAADRRSAC